MATVNRAFAAAGAALALAAAVFALHVSSDAAAQATNVEDGSIIAASKLTRTRTVQPVYPEEARQAGVEGWVELQFTVTPQGDVTDVEVRSAQPAGTFDEAAMTALKAWRFAPVMKDGAPVAQRAVVRLKFARSLQPGTPAPRA